MNRRHAASLLATSFVPTALAYFPAARVRAESPPTAIATASVTETPITALPTPSLTSSVDYFSTTGEYIVIGVVLGALAIAAGVLVVLWFVID
jgi:hypothetical protein